MRILSHCWFPRWSGSGCGSLPALFCPPPPWWRPRMPWNCVRARLADAGVVGSGRGNEVGTDASEAATEALADIADAKL